MAATIDSKKNKSILSKDSSGKEEDNINDILNSIFLPLQKMNLGPRKKLLVLNLGGLLCHRVYRYDTSKIPKNRRPDTSYGSILVYKRPFSQDFVKFCLERFEVGIWSSAKEWYLSNALRCVMGELKSKLLFSWDQNECTNSGFMTMENRSKPIFMKELKKIWENKYFHPGWRKGQFSASNTLMIEDTPYKALLNPPHTAIFVDEYTAYDTTDVDLGPKSELWRYLDAVADADDVPSYVKEHPFGKSAITPSHTDWTYYSKIVNAFKH